MSRLGKNAIANLAGQAFTMVVSLVAVKLIYHRLGADAYGLVGFSFLLTSVMVAALDLGISSTVLREVAAHVETDPAYVRRLIRTASLGYWLLWIVASAIVLILAPFFAEHWFHRQSLDAATATTVLRVLTVGALLTIPRSFYTSLFRARQTMIITNVIDGAAMTVQQLGTLLLLSMGMGFLVVAGWIASIGVLTVAAYAAAAGRAFGWQVIIPAYESGVIRRNLTFGAGLAAISILALIHTQSDQLIVSALLPLAQLGLFAFAASLASKGTLVTTAITQATYPAFVALVKTASRGDVLKQYRKLQDAMCILALPPFAAIALGGYAVSSFVFDPGRAQQMRLATVFLCLGTYLNATLSVPYILSLASNNARIAMKTNLLALFVTLPISLGMIHLYGLSGAGAAWVAYHLFVLAYAVPPFSRDVLGTAPSLFWRALARAAGPAVPAYGGAALATASLNLERDLTAVGAVYMVATVTYFGLAYLIAGSDLKAWLSYVRTRGVTTA